MADVGILGAEKGFIDERANLELKWVKDFLVLNDQRNFTRAAMERNVTQPAFSRRIKNLESWLGDALFDRSSKPLTLTRAGERFLPVAEELLRRAEQARNPQDGLSAVSHSTGTLYPNDAQGLGFENNTDVMGRIPLVAVLPFSSLKGGVENVHLSYGLAQLLADELSRLRYAQVANQMKVIKAHDIENTIENVVVAVGATHCLDGTYMVSGDRCRLTARLLAADQQELVWARRYDLKLDDIFDALDEIAGKISGALSGVFERTVGSKQPSSSGPGSFTAFASFARGNYILRTRYYSSYLAARKHFAAAIEFDPSFAKAYVGLAHTYAREYHTYPQRIELLHWAIDFASKAAELDPFDAYAQTWLAQFLAYSGEFDRSRFAAKRALEYLPNDPDTLMGCGVVEFFAGDYDKAEDFYLKAWEYEPVFMQRVRHALGHLMYLTRRFDEAERMYEGMSDTVAWNYSFRLANFGQLCNKEQLEKHLAFFREAFPPEQRSFPRHLFPFGDKCAVPLLIEGYEKAGILNEVWLQESADHRTAVSKGPFELR